MKLTRKELAAQMVLYPKLKSDVRAIVAAMDRGTVVAPQATFNTPQEVISHLHAHLRATTKLLHSYQGRYLPKNAATNATIDSAQLALAATWERTYKK